VVQLHYTGMRSPPEYITGPPGLPVREFRNRRTGVGPRRGARRGRHVRRRCTAM
jgi:hypothetical protein